MKYLITAVLSMSLFVGHVNAGEIHPQVDSTASQLRKNGHILAKNTLKTAGGVVVTGISGVITAAICNAMVHANYENVVNVLTRIVPEPVDLFDAYNKVTHIHSWAKFFHNNRGMIGIGTGIVGGAVTLFSAYKTLQSAINTVFFVDGDNAKKERTDSSL